MFDLDTNASSGGPPSDALLSRDQVDPQPVVAVEPEAPAAWHEAVGAALADALAEAVSRMGDLPVGEAGRHVLTDIAVAAARVEAWAVSVRTQAANALFSDFTAEHLQIVDATPTWAKNLAARSTTATLSLALGVSPPVASRMVDLADQLDDHPALTGAMADGRLDLAQVHVILDGAAQLKQPAKRARLVEAFTANPGLPEQRDRLVRQLRHDDAPVWQVAPTKLRSWVAQAVAELEPQSPADDEETAVDERRVAYSAQVGARPAELILLGPAHMLTACYDRIDAQARVAKKAGTEATLDQVRFDIAAGLLTDGAFGLVVRTPDRAADRRATDEASTGPSSTARTGSRTSTRVLVNVTVAKATLRGQDDVPATLHTPAGDQPISAGLARELASGEDAAWRTIVCDPDTGVATDVSSTYRPSTRLRELVTARDGRATRFPTSGARTLELDHVVEYDHNEPSRGGQTAATNLACSGKWDHQAKTDRLIHVEGDANDVLTFSTGTGHRYRSHPYPQLGRCLEPEPDPPPDGREPASADDPPVGHDAHDFDDPPF